MAKRLTDSDKWLDSWFRRLPAPCNVLWLYILDNCDAAGVWEIDLELFGLLSHFQVTEEQMKIAFGDRIVFICSGKKIWVPKFIDFQYGILKEDSKSMPILSVIKLLKKHTLWQGYRYPIDTLKDKEKDQDQDSLKGVVGETFSDLVFQVIQAYPRRREKTGGGYDAVHIGENDKQAVAEFIALNPNYPLLQAVQYYAKHSKRPKDLKNFLASPIALEVFQTAMALEPAQDKKKEVIQDPTPEERRQNQEVARKTLKTLQKTAF